MVLHVKHVVIDNGRKRLRRIVGNETRGVETSLGNAGDKLAEEHVVLMPERHEQVPGQIAVAVDLNPLVLSVTGTAVLRTESGADESLVIVGG